MSLNDLNSADDDDGGAWPGLRTRCEAYPLASQSQASGESSAAQSKEIIQDSTSFSKSSRSRSTKEGKILCISVAVINSTVPPHKRCKFQGCMKYAASPTSFCKAHGGGARCQFQGCTKSAQGSTSFCVAHGGGKRCQFQGCTKSARKPTSFCKAHGGGRRCAYSGCVTAALIKEYCHKHATVMGVRASTAKVGRPKAKRHRKGK